MIPSIDTLGPWGTFIVALITLIIGGGSGGFWVAYRKDRRQVPLDKAASEKAELDVLKQLREMAREAVAESVEEMKRQDERHSAEIRTLTATYEHQVVQLTERVALLEQAMRNAELPIP